MESKATMGDDNAITAFHMLKFLGRKVEKDDILGYVCYPPDRAKEVIFYHLKDLLEMVGCENHPAEKYLRKGDNKTLYGVSNLVTLNSFGMRDIPTLLKNAPPTPATASILQEVPGARHLGLRNTPYLRDQATMPRKVRVSGLFSRSGIKTVEDVENALMAHNIPVRRSTHSERDIVEKQKLYEKLSQVIIDYLNAKTQPVTRNERVYLHVDDIFEVLQTYWQNPANGAIPEESKVECGKDSNRFFDRRDIYKMHLLQTFLQAHPWTRYDNTTKMYHAKGLHNAVENRSQTADLMLDIDRLPEKVPWPIFARAVFDKNRKQTSRVNIRSILAGCYNYDGIESMSSQVGDVRYREYYLKTQSHVTKWDPDTETFALGGAITVLANHSQPDRLITVLVKELLQKGLIPRDEHYDANTKLSFKEIDTRWMPLLYDKGTKRSIARMQREHMFEAARPFMEQAYKPMPQVVSQEEEVEDEDEDAPQGGDMSWWNNVPPSAIASQLLQVRNIDKNSQWFVNTVGKMLADGENTKQAVEKTKQDEENTKQALETTKQAELNKEKSEADLAAERERTAQLKLRVQLAKLEERAKRSATPNNDKPAPRKRTKVVDEDPTELLRWLTSTLQSRDWLTRKDIYRAFEKDPEALALCPRDRYEAGTTSIFSWLVRQLNALAKCGQLESVKRRSWKYRVFAAGHAEEDADFITEGEEEDDDDEEYED